MKKLLFVIATLVVAMFCTVDVHASSFKVSFTGEDNFDDVITIKLKVDELDDFSGSCNGLCGLVGTLNYDKAKLEITEIDALEKFNLSQGKRIVLYKATGVKAGSSILTITFKNKGLKVGEATSISLTGITASDGNKDILGNDISKTVKLNGKDEEVKEEEKEEEKNEDKPVVKPEDKPTSKPVTPSVNKKEEVEKKSSDNTLKSIKLSDGSLNFDKDTLVYSVTVDNSVSSIKIDAIASSSKASVTGNGDFDLKIGENKFEITVKAEDGSKKTYTLKVYRDDEEELVEDDDIDVEEDVSEPVEKESNSSLLIIIVSAIVLALIVVGFIIFKKKD